MDFNTYISSIDIADDIEVNSLLKALKRIEGLPNSSDPRLLDRFLYRKLNKQQTFGFQKLFLRYKSLDKENEIPEDIKEEKAFSQAINLDQG